MTTAIAQPRTRARRALGTMLTAAVLVVSTALHAQSTPQGNGRFDPAAFFTGRTTSEGTLSQIFASRKTTRVSTFGIRQPDGSMVLDQTVKIGDQPERQRTWRLRETAPGRFSGTISDAADDLTGSLSGNALTLIYTMDNNLGVHQVITVNPGGQSARNVMRIRRFGITVARLEETIVRREGR